LLGASRTARSPASATVSVPRRRLNAAWRWRDMASLYSGLARPAVAARTEYEEACSRATRGSDVSDVWHGRGRHPTGSIQPSCRLRAAGPLAGAPAPLLPVWWLALLRSVALGRPPRRAGRATNRWLAGRLSTVRDSSGSRFALLAERGFVRQVGVGGGGWKISHQHSRVVERLPGGESGDVPGLDQLVLECAARRRTESR
jgi:hypothetical protein